MQKLGFVTLLILGCLIHTAKAELIVIAVSGTESFTPGSNLDPGQPIVVPEGARITILSKSGEMRVIDGPYSDAFAPSGQQNTSSEPSGQWDAVKSFMGHPDTRSEVLGVSRNIDSGVPPTPGVWQVSVDSSGPRCTQASLLTLWRRNAEKAQQVSIRSASNKFKGLNWEAGNEELVLPDQFVVEEGRMVVSVDGDLRDLEMHVMPEQDQDLGSGTLLTWLIEKQCNRQALSLIENVHRGNNTN